MQILITLLNFCFVLYRFKSLEADALQAQMMLQPRGRKSDGLGGSGGTRAAVSVKKI